MKKAIFSISEKHERIKIRYRRKRKSVFAICEDCGRSFDWLTVEEAANLTEKKVEEIRDNLKSLRKEHQTPKH